MAEVTPPTLPMLVQRFFLDYLGEQRAVSTQTVAAYRDTLRLLFNYAAAALRRTPSAITLPPILINAWRIPRARNFAAAESSATPLR